MTSATRPTQPRPRRRPTHGRMVLTPGETARYKAVLVYEDGRTSEHPFSALREGEAFLRSERFSA